MNMANLIGRDRRRRRRKAELIVSSALMCWATGAAAQSQTFSVDAFASAGFTSNAFLVNDGSTSTGFVEASVQPRFGLVDEQGATFIQAFARNTQYLDRFGSSQSYGIQADSNRRLTEKLSARVYAGFDSIILGERGLGNNLLGAEPVTVPTTPPVDPVSGAQPIPTPPPQPTVVLPTDVFTDVGLIGLRTRQNQFRAGGGLSYQLTEIDSISADANIIRSDYGDSRAGQLLSDYLGYGATLGYSRALSTQTQVGARLSAQKGDYDETGFSSSVYQPQLTISTRVSPLWTVSAAAGLMFVKSRTPLGTDNSTGFSGNVNGCRAGETSSLCLSAYRDATATGIGGVSKIVGAGVDYSYRLNQTDSIRASASYSKSDLTGELTSVIGDDELVRRFSSSYVNANVSYDRAFSRRLTGGATLGYRDVFDSGFETSGDISGQVFIRARFGDLQ
ncbi:MAG: hypothetical protein AVDCRST_MAG91-380 [uncultured Sphingomonadaceae bacterium]|uniref:Uncharacterized protein n=1 Tax=uncultured Sphingomonadaceae bacterium TaxID=169976 RepID=A0A6J4S1L4_9SPHN|nr:MAG: hypothetical protein AVDCRST_MAG91-380 [uncultured Sphingomonadaceae bacterium]